MKTLILAAIAAMLLVPVSLQADEVRSVYASPDGKTATAYKMDSEGYQYGQEIEFNKLVPQQKAGWERAMLALATKVPEGESVGQIIIERVANGVVTETETKEITMPSLTPDGEPETRTVTAPTAWEDDFTVIVSSQSSKGGRTRTWHVQPETRQFLQLMWETFSTAN